MERKCKGLKSWKVIIQKLLNGIKVIIPELLQVGLELKTPLKIQSLT